MHSSLLSDEEWNRIQGQLPIACIDLMPIRCSSCAPQRVEAIGLIRRGTPHQGERWCLVGGRLRYGESLGEGLQRQVRETLGDGVEISPAPTASLQPLYVAQYIPRGIPGEYQPGDGWDPRKHAIGLTYALALVGQPRPQGEANDFAWFPLHNLPSASEMGFGQEHVVAACLARLAQEPQS